MKRMQGKRWVASLLLSGLLLATSAHAALQGRAPATPGGTDYRAAYDDVLDITWVTNAALSGLGNWDDQVDWAANLQYLGFDD